MPPPNLQSSPQEDISAVMGRFHAWDSGRKITARNPPAEGTRELSYEEALAFSHNRRPARHTAASAPPAVAAIVADDIPAEPADKPLEASPSGASGKRSTLTSEGTIKQAPARSVLNSARKQAGDKTAPGKSLRASAEKAEVARTQLPPARKSSTRAHAADVNVPRKAKPQHQKPSMNAAPASTSVHVARKAGAPPRIAAGKESQKASHKSVKRAGQSEARKSVTFRGALAACLVEAPRGKTVAKPSPGKKKPPVKATSLHASRTSSQNGRHQMVIDNAKRTQSMRTLSAASPAKKATDRKSVESIARTISVNLRLSQAEHDRMSRGAAEADLTLATFIRESTLRFQVSRQKEKQALLEAGFSSNAHMLSMTDDEADESYDRPIVEPAGPSLLARMKNFWLGRRLAAMA